MLKQPPASCSFRYDDAVIKYETVMTTEPNVHHFSLLAKERICHALAQVRRLTDAIRCIDWLCLSGIINPALVFALYYDQGQKASKAISVCSEVLQSEPENVNVLKDRAEAHIQEEQYEEGRAARWSCMIFWFVFSLKRHSEPKSHFCRFWL